VTITLTHKFVSAIPDGADATVVRPSNWNDTHDVTGTLPIANGGTNTTSVPANGQLLIGNGTDYTVATLTAGTGMTITNTAGGITLSAPENGTVTGVTASSPIASSGGTAPNISLTGTVPVANGGTGQTTYTDGQLLIGNTTGNTLAKATLTAGTGVTITNGAGTITISAPDTGTVTSVTASSPLASSGGATPNLSLTGTVAIANGGTNSTATATAGGAGYGTGTAHAYTAAGTLGQVLTSAGAGTPTWTTLTTGVSSVSNSDGTLTISPTTGAVVASLALGHANSWSGVQTFTTPVLGAATGTSLALGGATIGTNALAVTGTSTFSSTVTHSGATTLSGALT
jgi:hypothetical protein